MSSMPRGLSFDSTLGLLRDPYRFIGQRCSQIGSAVFQTRILLRRTICGTGSKFAALFYDARRFTRIGAAPEPARATLFGKGGVQGLEGEAHQYRKAMFLSVLTPARVEKLSVEVAAAWDEAIGQWQQRKTVVLYEGAQALLTQAVCRWAGVPVPAEHLPSRTRELVSLFDEAASLRHFHSRRARARAEKWLSALIEEFRSRSATAANDSALSIIAHHRDSRGALLPLHVAAVELLNVLHDPMQWTDPEAFRPERFGLQQITDFNLIPQGGGDVRLGHRCPGEAVALAAMKVSVEMLARQLRYRVPVQDLRIHLQRLPAIPRSGFVIADVKRA